MQQPDFHAALDRMILSGMPPSRIARHFEMSERTVRRRRTALRSEGHLIPDAPGYRPEKVFHVIRNHR